MLSSTTTIEISTKDYQRLLELSEIGNETVQSALNKAIDAYYRQVFFTELNRAYERLRNDPELWQEELAERQAWDVTLMDGIEDD